MQNTVRCPSCQRELIVPDQVVGEQVQCGVCRSIFTAVSSQTYPSHQQETASGTSISSKYQRVNRRIEEGNEENETRWEKEIHSRRRRFRRRRPRASDDVKGPAYALMAVGITGLAFGVIGIFFRVLRIALASGQVASGQVRGTKEDGLLIIFSGLSGIIWVMIVMAISAVIVWGAVKMKNLENYGFAMTVSILAMIPCVSPICLLGLPFGIWSLVVLSRPDVKEAFRSS